MRFIIRDFRLGCLNRNIANKNKGYCMEVITWQEQVTVRSQSGTSSMQKKILPRRRFWYSNFVQRRLQQYSLWWLGGSNDTATDLIGLRNRKKKMIFEQCLLYLWNVFFLVIPFWLYWTISKIIGYTFVRYTWSLSITKKQV